MNDINSAVHVQAFFKLLSEGKQAALDARIDTGEVICRVSLSMDKKSIGNGNPGVPYSSQWIRLAACENFNLLREEI